MHNITSSTTINDELQLNTGDIIVDLQMLYSYINGNNLDGRKLNMTTPVATQFFPTEEFRQAEKNFTVSFFLPFKFQVNPTLMLLQSELLYTFVVRIHIR